MNRDIIFKVDNNGSFTDYSQEAQDYLRDNILNTFTAANDSIYVGLYKPFPNVYVELDGLPGLSLGFEYFNGSFSTLSVKDDTKSFSRPGYIRWDNPGDWQTTSIDGIEAYWIKINPDIDVELDIKGCNIVYADDIDLAKHQRDINNFLAKGDTSFIAYHVSARDEIIQRIRNSGIATKRENEDFFRNFTKWDVLDISEINEAATHLALSKINFDISEGQDDKYYQRYKEHGDMFGASFKLYFRTFDLNDDGIVDIDKEKLRVRTVTLSKI